jgi:hypothetical protein
VLLGVLTPHRALQELLGINVEVVDRSLLHNHTCNVFACNLLAPFQDVVRGPRKNRRKAPIADRGIGAREAKVVMKLRRAHPEVGFWGLSLAVSTEDEAIKTADLKRGEDAWLETCGADDEVERLEAVGCVDARCGNFCNGTVGDMCVRGLDGF